MATRVNKREYANPSEGIRIVELQCSRCRQFVPAAQAVLGDIWASDMMLTTAVCVTCENMPIPT